MNSGGVDVSSTKSQEVVTSVLSGGLLIHYWAWRRAPIRSVGRAWVQCSDVIGREAGERAPIRSVEGTLGKTRASFRRVGVWGLCFDVIGRELERSRTNEKRWKVCWTTSTLLRHFAAWRLRFDVIYWELEKSRTNEKRWKVSWRTSALLGRVAAWGLCFTVTGRELERSRTNEKHWNVSRENLCVVKTRWGSGTVLRCDWSRARKVPHQWEALKSLLEDHAHQSETLEQ